MKKSTIIISVIGTLALIGGIFLWKKNKSGEGKSLENSDDASVSTDTEQVNTKMKKGTGTAASSSGRKGTSPMIFKISTSSFKNAESLTTKEIGKQLGWDKTNAEQMNRLNSYFKGLPQSDRRLVGFLINLPVSRLEDGSFKNAFIAQEGEQAMQRLIALSNQIKDVGEGNEIVALEAPTMPTAPSTFGRKTKPPISSEDAGFAFNGHIF